MLEPRQRLRPGARPCRRVRRCADSRSWRSGGIRRASDRGASSIPLAAAVGWLGFSSLVGGGVVAGIVLVVLDGASEAFPSGEEAERAPGAARLRVPLRPPTSSHRSLRTITSCNPFASGARLPRLVRGKPPTGSDAADCTRIPRMGFSTESTRSGDEIGWSRCCFGKRICRADGSPTRPLRLGRFRGGLRALPRRCPCTRSASDHPAWIRRRAAPLAERRGRGAGRLTARPRRSKHGRHGRNWQHR